MSIRRKRLVLAFAALAVAGCGAAPAANPVSVRDSAGIRIVEVPLVPPIAAPAGGIPYRLTAELDLSIGVVDGDEDYAFDAIDAVETTPDGRIIVLEGIRQSARVYSPDGRALVRIGRRGGGPTEFSQIRGMWLNADTLVFHDPGNRKLARFSADGAFLDSRPFGIGPDGLLGGRYVPIGEDGFVATSVSGCRMPRTPDHIDNRWVRYITDHDGSIIDTLDVRTGTSMLSVYGEAFCSAYSMPFGARAAFARGPNNLWALHDGDGYAIRVFRLRSPAQRASGSADRGMPAESWMYDVTLLRRQYQPRALTDAERRLHRDTLLARQEGPLERQAVQAALNQYSYPDSWPAYYDLRFDDRGRLWVLRTGSPLPGQPRAAQTVWDVYESDGSPAHEVVLPSDVGLRSVRGDFVYGVSTDDLGVNYVRRWRLVPAN